jgi:hypothetical protein
MTHLFEPIERTPDNLFPSENTFNPRKGWDCSDFIQQIYSGGAAQVFRETIIPSWHPYKISIWNGSCDSGQLTREGFEDSIKHGRVGSSTLVAVISD